MSAAAQEELSKDFINVDRRDDLKLEDMSTRMNQRRFILKRF